MWREKQILLRPASQNVTTPPPPHLDRKEHPLPYSIQMYGEGAKTYGG